MGDPKTIYSPCDHIKRPAIDWTVDQDLIHSIATEFRTLPSFENTSYEHILTRHYSLQNNEFLKCRWNQYKSTIETKVFTPFEFPAAKDLHFYNNTIRFLPNLTTSRRKTFRMQTKPGPGIDYKGQMYIPYEMFMKRGISQKEGTKKRVKEPKIEKIEEVRDEKNKCPCKGKEETKPDDVKVQKNAESDNITEEAKRNIKSDIKKDDKITKKRMTLDSKKDDKLTKKGMKTDLKKDNKIIKKDRKIDEKKEIKDTKTKAK